MLKSLFPQVDWNKIRIVGFDMDGTLYDEFDFIAQAYRPISNYLSKHINMDEQQIYDNMLLKWLNKGSSYNFIFSEELSKFNLNDDEKKEIESKCLTIYRNLKPYLSLPKRVEILLQLFKAEFKLFLVTDGRPSLQNAKFLSLGLDNWFQTEDIFITGSYGRGYEKPSILILDKIDILDGYATDNIIYFGDRGLDEKFALAAGFKFIKVYCMIPR